MRIESSVTCISWIPSAAIAGTTRIPFQAGVMHYDDPPPDEWRDLDSVLGPGGARFAGHELAGASSFPRHWIYDTDGKLAGKSAVIDFKTWYRTSNLARSPWHGQDNAVLAAEAETSLERRLSLAVMRGGGAKPRSAKVKAGATIMAEGQDADDIVLVLDGLVEVETRGIAVARLGPGAILGERASLEQGRRTATVRALTGCRIVSYPATALPPEDLRELATGHRREDQLHHQ
jgi:hypothetical protein